MSDRICPFSATLAKQDFACPHAAQVIRRGGTEFSCQSAASRDSCMQMHENMKQAALPAFDLEDDLLQVPHGVLARIQFGGLLGLQRMLARPVADSARVEDIDALVTAALARYGDADAVPCSELVADIQAYQPARRRRR